MVQQWLSSSDLHSLEVQFQRGGFGNIFFSFYIYLLTGRRKHLTTNKYKSHLIKHVLLCFHEILDTVVIIKIAFNLFHHGKGCNWSLTGTPPFLEQKSLENTWYTIHGYEIAHAGWSFGKQDGAMAGNHQANESPTLTLSWWFVWWILL